MLILSLKIVLQILKGFGQTGSEAYLPAFFQFLSHSKETLTNTFLAITYYQPFINFDIKTRIFLPTNTLMVQTRRRELQNFAI